MSISVVPVVSNTFFVTYGIFCTALITSYTPILLFRLFVQDSDNLLSILSHFSNINFICCSSGHFNTFFVSLLPQDSECSLSRSDSCTSSCESECHTGNSSDSGVHHEPFYLHPPPAATSSGNTTASTVPLETESKNKKDKKKNGNNNTLSNKQKNNSSNKNNAKNSASLSSTSSSTNSFFLNPLTDLKEASEKYSKQKAETSKGEDGKKGKKPFFLHKPEEVSYHRVQELFGGKSGSGKGSIKGDRDFSRQNDEDDDDDDHYEPTELNGNHVSNENGHHHHKNGKSHSHHKKSKHSNGSTDNDTRTGERDKERRGKVDYAGRKLPSPPTSNSTLRGEYKNLFSFLVLIHSCKEMLHAN